MTIIARTWNLTTVTIARPEAWKVKVILWSRYWHDFYKSENESEVILQSKYEKVTCERVKAILTNWSGIDVAPWSYKWVCEWVSLGGVRCWALYGAKSAISDGWTTVVLHMSGRVAEWIYLGGARYWALYGANIYNEICPIQQKTTPIDKNEIIDLWMRTLERGFHQSPEGSNNCKTMMSSFLFSCWFSCWPQRLL